MTKKRIRIVMAECCGWAQQTFKGYSSEDQYTFKEIRWHKDGKYIAENPPNYPDDLNAVHEAIKSFDLKTLMKFSDHLKNTVQDKLCIQSTVDARYMTLQAETVWWCEAFIKTVCPEKWEEGK